MSTNSSLIQQIQNNVVELINENKALHAKVFALQEENAKLQDQLSANFSDVASLKQEIINLENVKSNASTSALDGHNVKLRINDLVGEIDRCIALLNK